MTAIIEAIRRGTDSGPSAPRSASKKRAPKLKKKPTPRPPTPPRRPPVTAVQRVPLTPMTIALRTSLLVFAALIMAFCLNVLVVSHVQHVVAQQQLSDEYRSELAAGTAPVSEGDFNGALLADGAPVAIIDIPQIGVHEVVLEGSTADVLKSGPGHRRDTVLPGQRGVSLLFGRAAAFGGPFGSIAQLSPGDKFTVLTGQGEQQFSVIGLRYAGEPSPALPTANQSRLVLVSARGALYSPSGVAYVDAQLTSSVQPAGTRQTTTGSLSPNALAMSSDFSTLWALVFALQFLILAEIAAVWAHRKVGPRKAWVVFAPITIVAVLFVANQLTILLPNLL